MHPDSLAAIAEEYYEWMQVTNYSERTIQNCRRNLGYFFTWCEERGLLRPADVTKPIVERYQRHLFYYRQQRTGQPLTPGSQQVRLTAIRTFFKWLARKNYVLYNPAGDLYMPRAEHRLPHQSLTLAEVERVLSQPDLKTNTGIRDRAILETFYSTGIRRLELIKLTVYNVDLERETLFICQGKGKKDRMLPIGTRALDWIEQYLYDIRPQYVVPPDQGCLFLTRWGGPFSINTLSYMVKRHLQNANINKQGSCHLFRHTMATLMLENGADIRYIQQMLGHAAIESTKVYTQVSIRTLKAVHSQTHPASYKPRSKRKSKYR
ncbi:site-specific tyrosine recombinase XerC [candidate division CSSED10-310 bacterium]|uniref:Site-specific tyrosine recombinase XerC n=1 Tax=candidate division CSSED10-310 bacterium TaxID=2855610 RepID=A0ABV6Z613_UNCC1